MKQHLKTIWAYLWARFEPSNEEKRNMAERLLAGTPFHVHGNPIAKPKEAPLFAVKEGE